MSDNVAKLNSACLDGDISTAESLLSSGTSVNSPDTDGRPPLFCAAREGHTAVVELLLERPGAEVNVTNKNGVTPLYIASQEDHRDTVQLLLQHGASVNQATTTDGATPLFIASQNDHRDTVQLLLQNGASVNQAKTDTGATPLFKASQEAHLSVVSVLLEHGASVNQATTDIGVTPLYVASQNDHRDTVQLLLHNGASVNQATTDDGRTPLFIASQNGHLSVVSVLLEHGASVNQAQTTTGPTPLFQASQNGHLSVVSVLLEHGASAHRCGKYGTPLDAARRNGHRAVVEALKQHTASVKQKKVLASETDKKGNIVPGEVKTVTQKIKAFFSKGKSTSQKLEGQENTQQGEKLATQKKAPDSETEPKGKTVQGQDKNETITRKLELSRTVCAFLSSEQTQKRFMEEFSKQGIMVKFDDIQVSLSSKTEKELLRAEQLIHSMIEENQINTKPYESEGWNKLCASIRKDYKGELIVEVNDITGAIHVAGLKHVIPAVLETIQRFLAREEFHKSQGSSLFHQGDSTTMKWTEAEKKMLTETSAMRVLYVGESEAGKTSLVGTILSGDSYLAHADGRTVVAELNHWVVRDQKNDKSTFSLVDLGGHQSYLSSGHFFHCNSRNNIATLCHNITSNSKNYYRSFMWLKSVLTRSPKCHIAIALTKCDLLSEQEQQEKLKLFRDKLKVHLQKEIRSLEDSIYFSEKNESSRLSTFIELRNKYEWIIQEMAEITVLVSCKKKESVGALTDMYVQLSEKPENKVLLPVHFHTVFTRSGNLGMKIIDVIKAIPQPVDISNDALDMINRIDSESDDSDDIDASQEEISVTGDQTSSELPLNANTSQQPIPIQLNKTMEKKVSQYMTLEEVMEVYTDVLVYHNLPASKDLKADTQRCLNYLHQHGLMMYFPVGGALENIVFNNINTFVVIMRSVFHHDLRQYLECFNTLPVQFRSEFYGNDETRFKADVELLQSQGLLSESILQILLHKSECQIEPEAVLQLLDLLEIGFSYIPEMMDTNTYMFIPFFLEKKHSTEEIQAEIAQLENSDHKSLSVHCQVRGNLSLTLWHYLVVRFCKKLIHNNMQRREIWSDGFLAYVGKSDAMLHLKFNGEDKIDMKVKANVTTTTGHDIIWQYIRLLSSEISELMRDWWPGLVTSKILFCTHCMCQQKTTDDCCEWSIEQLLDSKSCQNETCCCQKEQGKQLPSALLMPLPLDAKRAQVRLTALCGYLSETFAKSQDNTEDPTIETSLERRLERLETKILPYVDYRFRLPQIHNHLDQLLEGLVAPEVLDYLFQGAVLSDEDYEDIKAFDSTPRKQTRMLLCKVDERGQQALKVLVSAVREQPQLQHLLVYLEDKELHTISDKMDRSLIESTSMAKEMKEKSAEPSLHKKVNELEQQLTHITGEVAKLKPYDDTYDFKSSLIRQNYEALVSGIYPDDVVDYLYQEATLSVDDYERVRAQLTTRDQSRLILIKVDARGDDGINKLCAALDKTPQAHLINLLK